VKVVVIDFVGFFLKVFLKETFKMSAFALEPVLTTAQRAILNFTPLFTPRGEHSLLFRRMEGQTENFTPRG
jgi:hypothetical protein